VKGVELNAVIPKLSFLPTPFDNFGISANATLLDATPPPVQMADRSFRTLRGLFESSKYTYNATVFYTDPHFYASISYNRTSPFYVFVSTSSALDDRTVGTQNIFSGQIRYYINPRAALTFDASNFLNDRPVRRIGVTQSLTREELDNGRAVFIGASFKL
jgi:hypothetical protein